MLVNSSTTRLPQLNFDVLFEVMRQIEQRGTMLQMMYTCRTLYKGGIRLLLALQITIDMDNDWEQFQSFCHYIVADVSRCQHIRSLAIANGYPAGGIWTDFEKEALLAVAHNASNLESLEITGYPLYIQFLESVKSLKQLKMKACGALAVSFVSHVKSPLRHLDIEFNYREDFGEAIRPHQEFLQTLRVFRCNLSDIRESLTVFSNVTSLHFKDADVRYTDGTFLMKRFPNLRDLSHTFDGVNSDRVRNFYQIPPQPEPKFRDLKHIRRASIAEQRRSGCGWPSLKRLAGDVYWVYCLGVTCPVRELIFENEPLGRVNVHLACCKVLLEFTRPTQMYYDVWADGQCKYYTYRIVEVVGPTVRKLELKINGMIQQELQDVLRRKQLSVPSTTCIEQISLSIKWLRGSREADEGLLFDLARKYADAIHSLQSVEVIIRNVPVDTLRLSWKVGRSDGHVSLYETHNVVS
ncbi:hypothetical protein BDW22DRAFT_988620 [Trametopsis cervina]|nr:hypothetical protein BDW22DRAFT_988620 [Trametopsis cervina]